MKSAMRPIISSDRRILILGSMPGEKSLQLQQYYGNRGNHFWKLLFEIFEEPFTFEYSQRLDLLKKNGIALWDVLQICEREGSLDSNIKNEIPNDFSKLYIQYPNIQYVFFASKAAEKYYDKYAGKRCDIIYSVLPSPSGANAGTTFAQKLKAWSVLRFQK